VNPDKGSFLYRVSRGKGERTPALVNYVSARGPIEIRPSVIFQATTRRFVPRAPIRSVLCKGAWNISRVANRALRLRSRRARLSSRPAVKCALQHAWRNSRCVFYESGVKWIFLQRGKGKSGTTASPSRCVRKLFSAKSLIFFFHCVQIAYRLLLDSLFIIFVWLRLGMDVDFYIFIVRSWVGEKRGNIFPFHALDETNQPKPVVPIVPEYDKFFPRREKGSLHPQYVRDCFLIPFEILTCQVG